MPRFNPIGMAHTEGHRRGPKAWPALARARPTALPISAPGIALGKAASQLVKPAREFRPNGLLAEGPGGAEVLVGGDTMVVALGMQPNRGLADSLREKWDVLHIVGDCVEPAKVGEAVRAGFMAGWHVWGPPR
jgi:hypothetical protein